MGLVVRDRDRAFLAVAVPVALAALYVVLWRNGASRRLDALSERHVSLVAVEDFESEMARAGRLLKDSEAELAAELAVPESPAKAVAPEGSSLAERERAVIGVFAAAGLAVLRCEIADEGSPAAGDALSAAVGRGTAWRAVRRRYVLDGTYPAVKKALDVFAARKMAVVPDGVSMRGAGRGRWTVEIWL